MAKANRIRAASKDINGTRKKGVPRDYSRRREWLHGNRDFDGASCLAYPFSRSTNGYSIITLTGSGQMSVHRYMCLMVHGEPPSDEHEVAHSCGNKNCVNPKHLRWATKAENAADRLLHGTHGRGEKNGMAKLSAEDVKEIIAKRGVETGRSLAKRFGVSAAQISNIQLGRQWSYKN